MNTIPELRIRRLNQRDIREDGDYVLYWMTAFRRLNYNFALQRAAYLARLYGRSLWILETLYCNYPWASDRFHTAVLDGIDDHLVESRHRGIQYYPYVERERGEIVQLLQFLSGQAAAIVIDDFPSKFQRNLTGELSRTVKVRMEAVDSNGLLPMRAATQIYQRAFSFRRFLQKELPSHLAETPLPDPVPPEVTNRHCDLPQEVRVDWPAYRSEDVSRADLLAALPIDHAVPSVKERMGPNAAQNKLQTFVQERLGQYSQFRNYPNKASTSELSSYLHLGHISAHEVFQKVVASDGWSPARLSKSASGKREGWWGVSENAEAFLDELITWREVGYNMAWQCDNYDQYSSLPDWAKETLAVHAVDVRPEIYSFSDLEHGSTHDALWNASQNQLVREGRIHNYLRMLWGKKILEWTRSPQEAMEFMIELNNRYALDGRNPNSYSGIFWVLGRYDRPWGPERPIFGKIRYMSSENTARKFPVAEYIQQYNTGLLFT